MLELREISWKISFSSTVILVFFISIVVLTISGFGFLPSIAIAVLVSLLTAVTMSLQKDKILKPPL